jgi:hypothetical protein
VNWSIKGSDPPPTIFGTVIWGINVLKVGDFGCRITGFGIMSTLEVKAIMPEQNKYHFLDDRPTSDDHVGTHSRVAETLAKLIHADLRRPFVIGLFGPWGVGKSSIVRMLQEAVTKTKNGAKVVVVDAWESTADSFLRQFVKKLAIELLDKKFADEVAKKTDIKNVENKNFWEPDPKAIKWFVGFIITLLILLAALVLSYISAPKEYKDFPADKIAIMAVTFLIAVYFQFLLPKYSVKTTRSEEDVTIHDVTHFREIYFKDIIACCKQQTVCIVVDNLDRIGADDAIGIMRAIKTFIVDAEAKGSGKNGVERNALNKVVFVVPCDDGALRKQLFNEEKGDGNEFLRKFFNVSIRIPSLIDRDAYRYACNLIDQTKLSLTKIQKERMANIIKCLFGNNPRQPKIFINNFLARYMVAERLEQERKIPEGVATGQPDLLAIYVALDAEFSDLQMPKTAAELKDLRFPPIAGTREERRMVFLQKIDSLVEGITASTWASYHYLKKANDALLIPGFEELEESAMRGTENFPDELVEVQAKNPTVLEALWNAASGDEAQLKMMRSILWAKKRVPALDIKGRLSDEMIGVINRLIDYLPPLPTPIVYELFRERVESLCKILNRISGAEADSKAELYAEGGQRHFHVQLVKEALSDIDLPRSVENPLNKALDFLAQRCDELTMPALKVKKGTSIKILEKGIGLFNNGNPEVHPSDLIDYCGKFPPTQYRGHLNQIVQILVRSLAQGKYSTKYLCDGTRRLNQLIKKDNITDTDMTPILGGLNNRYQVERDNWPAKAEIIRTLADYVEEGSPNQWRNQARQILLDKGSLFLHRGEETVVCTFLKDSCKLVNSHFTGVLPDVARRSETLCHTILDFYPKATREAVRAICQNNCVWVQSWIKKTPKISAEQVKSIQSGIFDILPPNYREDMYNLLGLLDISGLDDANKQQRDGHFTNLLVSKKPLTMPANLAFVLRRMQLMNYIPTKEQCTGLDKAIDDTDRETVTSNETLDLIKGYQRAKKKGSWTK